MSERCHKCAGCPCADCASHNGHAPGCMVPDERRWPEYVRAMGMLDDRKIATHVDGKRLGLDERLKLVLKPCDHTGIGIPGCVMCDPRAKVLPG